MVASAENKNNILLWAVAAGGFIANLCVIGFQRTSCAVFFVYFIEDFNITREEAAWPTGLVILFQGVSAVVCGHLTNYFSIRSILVVAALINSGAIFLCSFANSMWQINILYGVLQGIGGGPIFTLTQVIIVNCFASHRTTAMGIGMAGTAVGSIVGSRIAQWLIEEYGLQSAFLLVSGIALNSLVGAVLMKDPQSERTPPAKIRAIENECTSNEEPNTNSIELKESANIAREGKRKQEKEKIPFKEMKWLKNIIHSSTQVFSVFNFYMIMFVYVIVLSKARLYTLITVDLAEERFIPPEQGVFLLSVWSFGELTGRLSIGLVVDRKWFKLKTIWLFLIMLNGVFAIAVTFCNNYDSLMSVSVLLGFIYGAIIVNLTPMYAQYLNRQIVPLASGIGLLFGGIVVCLLPVIVGFFKDRTHSYGLIFVFFGVAHIALAGVWIFASAIKKLMRNKEIPPSDIGESRETSF